jgi:hypothetical protein
MSSDEIFDNMQQQATDSLGEWGYPGAQYCGGGMEDTMLFFHAHYQTTDLLEQIGAYYWKKLSPNRSFEEKAKGGSTYFMDTLPKWVFRFSPPG